jgi:hypothetical protein
MCFVYELEDVVGRLWDVVVPYDVFAKKNKNAIGRDKKDMGKKRNSKQGQG